MKYLRYFGIISVFLASHIAGANAEVMQIFKKGAQSTMLGPKENFTGVVKVSKYSSGEDPSRLNSASVSFEKNARSAWHTHPAGQLLIVVEGSGLVQEWGHSAKHIGVGDVIWTPPGVKHWHGASPDSSMTHIAALESINGKQVEWMEKVSAKEYLSAK